jgi:uncharacterized iron-regulated membrane protein
MSDDNKLTAIAAVITLLIMLAGAWCWLPKKSKPARDSTVIARLESFALELND